MVTIVDAYNCLYAAGKLLDTGSPVSLRTLCRWCGHAPGKIILVMDGVRKPHEPHADEFPNLHFVFPGSGAKADPMIARLVREFRDRNPTGHNLCVVSSDKAVLHQARGERVMAQTAESFLRGLLQREGTGKVNRKGRAKPAPLLPGVRKTPAVAKPTDGDKMSAETRYWLERFGFTGCQSSAAMPQTPATGAHRSAESATLDATGNATGESDRKHKTQKPPPRPEKAAPPQTTDLAGLNLDELLGPVKPLKIKKNRAAALPARRPRPDHS